MVARSPLPWSYVGFGLIILIFVTSLGNVKNSVVGAKDMGEVVEIAAKRGDYPTAQKLFNQYTNEPLNHLENIVYPERVVERRISELEAKLEEYPENKEVLLEVSRLYGEIGNREKAQDYREQARILDPNSSIFQP